MYIILVYDMAEKKCSKALKICRRYLTHIQNSVFEGELTESQIFKLKGELKKLIGENETDSVIIFRTRSEKWLEREIVGVEKHSISNII